MIELENITQMYGEFRAVNGISTHIDRGEVIGLVGPNGAGKTTTMKIVTGYLVPTQGKVTVDGVDVIFDPSGAQQKIGYLPESAPLYPEMPVQDYLVFIAKMRGVTGAAVTERLRYVADACGIRDKLVAPIRTLSKGYRQRVGIAQAIIHDPQILILDEPTSGLDPNQIIEIRDLIRALGEDKTVILSTHILSEVEESCSRAIMIVAGEIRADDDIDTLRGGTDVRFEVLEPAQGAEEAIRKVEGVGGVARVGGEEGRASFQVAPANGRPITADLHRLAVNHGWTVTRLSSERRSLEDVFREVSQGGSAS